MNKQKCKIIVVIVVILMPVVLISFFITNELWKNEGKEPNNKAIINENNETVSNKPKENNNTVKNKDVKISENQQEIKKPVEKDIEVSKGNMTTNRMVEQFMESIIDFTGDIMGQKYIDEMDAKSVAIESLNIEDSGIIAKAQKNLSQGKMTYIVTLKVPEYTYEVELDAITGEILGSKRDGLDLVDKNTTTQAIEFPHYDFDKVYEAFDKTDEITFN